MANDVLVYRTGDTAFSDMFVASNIFQFGVSAVIGGQWPATTPTIPLKAHYHLLSYGSHGPTMHRLTLMANNESWDSFVYARRGTDAFDVFHIDRNATFYWGSGAGAEDTFLYRSASNRLTTTGGFGMYDVTPPATQPAANPDTSGATLAALETEVNQLKALLRSFGMMAT
jgi:hypothetical protein